MQAITDLDPKQIKEIIYGWPHMVWMRDGRVFCVPHDPMLSFAFAEYQGISFNKGYDAWGDLCEPYVDTENSEEYVKKTMQALQAAGFDENEVAAIRQRIGAMMLAYNSVVWDWAGLSLSDAREAFRFYGRKSDFKDATEFENWSSEIASRPWRTEDQKGIARLPKEYYAPLPAGVTRVSELLSTVPRKKRSFIPNVKKVIQSTRDHFEFIAKATASASDPGRVYHGIRHLEEALILGQTSFIKLAGVKKLDSDSYRRIQWAILYHDAVYVAGRSDNEQKSAELAAVSMKEQGEGLRDIRFVQDLILWTKQHRLSEVDSVEKKVMHDADLGILGLAPSRYKEYTEQVKSEWVSAGIVNDVRFREGRLKFLDKVLSEHAGSDFFFGLDPLHSKLAVVNLENEIRELRQ